MCGRRWCAGARGCRRAPPRRRGSDRQGPLASSLLATELGVDKLVLATDVDAVYESYGTDRQRAIARATPAGLRRGEFPAGSMGPKVEAVCRFVERTGGIGVIGSLEQVPEMLEGRAGTRVRADGPEIEYARGGRS